MSHTLQINGQSRTVDADGETPLLWVLRDRLGMRGTKYGCGIGQCGACTVLINGVAARACQLTVAAAAGLSITTIEGVGAMALGQRVQAAWLAHDVPQCGYCQGGQILAATSLLGATPKPTDADIDAAMRGNLCRCGTYVRIRAAIKAVAAGTDSKRAPA